MPVVSAPRSRAHLAAVVLAGGRSTRFGRDKAGLQVGGRPLLDRIVGALAPVCDPVVVVRRPDQRLPALSHPAVELSDPAGLAGEGPLVGLLSALGYLERAGVPTAFVTACDMPRVDADLARCVAARLGRHGTMILPDDAGGRAQYLAAAVRVSVALSHTRRLVAAGERSMRALAASLRADRLPAALLPDPSALAAFNTAEAFARIFGAPPP